MLIRKNISIIALAAALAVTAWAPAALAGLNPPASDPEPAPIVENRLDYRDFTLKDAEGRRFNLRDYAAGKKLVLVAYVAGWCENSINNGHVVKRLYDKYKDKGFAVVAVSEYSTPEEVGVYVRRIGIDFPLVIETDNTGARKDSVHYDYRTRLGDTRKWGTPFYVFISAADVEPPSGGGIIARRVHTVTGEIIEPEAEAFIEHQLGIKGD